MNKVVVEHFESLSVFWLRKHGYFDGLEGQDSYTRNTGEQSISLTSTPCNFGGYRFWFLCPACGKRVAILYKDGDYRCRDCHNLTYLTRQFHRYRLEGAYSFAKALRKTLKILDGIGRKGPSKVERLQLQKLLDKCGAPHKFLT